MCGQNDNMRLDFLLLHAPLFRQVFDPLFSLVWYVNITLCLRCMWDHPYLSRAVVYISIYATVFLLPSTFRWQNKGLVGEHHRSIVHLASYNIIFLMLCRLRLSEDDFILWSRWIFHSLGFRVVTLLDWLPSNVRDPRKEAAEEKESFFHQG